MSANPGAPTRDEIREYLLRRLPEVARASFEEAYFRDDALLDRIETEEDGLILDYVLGRLSQTDRRRFEESLLGSSYYRDRVQSTTQLNLKLMKSQAFKRPTSPRAAQAEASGAEERLFPGRSGSVVATALLLVLLLASLLATLHFKTQYQKAVERAAAAEARKDDKPRPIFTKVLGPPAAAGPMVIDAARPAGALLQLAIPREALPGDAAQLRPLLLGSDGRIVWDGGLRAVEELPAGDLLLTLPEELPPAGVSSVTLEAVTPSGIRFLTLGYLRGPKGTP